MADVPENGRVVPEVGGCRLREAIFGRCRIIYSVREQVDILNHDRNNASRKNV